MPRNTRCHVRLAALAGLLLAAATPTASAHCDTYGGPVVAAARAALETKTLQPVLKWVKPSEEAELRSAFERTLAVRTQSVQARELADQYFLETAVRLHRAGEGAPFTGLRREAADPGGFIAATDQSVASGSSGDLTRLVSERMVAALRHRHELVVEARRHADHDAEAGRRYVQKYVEYLHFVEQLQQLVTANTVASAHQHDR